jgi:hypothetical protein
MPDVSDPSVQVVAPGRADHAGHAGHGQANSAATVLPGEFTPRVVGVFAWYVRRLLSKKFYAIRAVGNTAEVLKTAAAVPGPVMVLVSHAAWWDPLICTFLGRECVPGRTACAPMDITQLRKFNFFRKLGLFGIDPDSKASMRAMGDYVAARFASDPLPTLWITPQGRFADVRSPLRIRPGAAAIAGATPNIHVISLAIEYTFWLDQRPEVMLRLQRVESPARVDTLGWQRMITSAMSYNQSALAAAVMARDPGAFTTLLGGGTARTNILYDLWRRLRGSTTDVSDTHRKGDTP